MSGLAIHGDYIGQAGKCLLDRGGRFSGVEQVAGESACPTNSNDEWARGIAKAARARFGSRFELAVVGGAVDASQFSAESAAEQVCIELAGSAGEAEDDHVKVAGQVSYYLYWM